MARHNSGGESRTANVWAGFLGLAIAAVFGIVLWSTTSDNADIAELQNDNDELTGAVTSLEQQRAHCEDLLESDASPDRVEQCIEARIDVEALPGPAGEQGAQGIPGLQGLPGADGQDGATGPRGPAGPPGADGRPGAPGVPGADGQDGAEGPSGATGDTGPQGSAGTDGSTGADGATAYELAVTNGFVGSVQEWLASLQGPKGEQGPPGPEGDPGPACPDGWQPEVLIVVTADGGLREIQACVPVSE